MLQPAFTQIVFLLKVRIISKVATHKILLILIIFKNRIKLI